MLQAFIKTGDTRTPIAGTLKTPKRAAVNLEGTKVMFVMSQTIMNYLGNRGKTDEPPLINAEATILDAAAGRVAYPFKQGETDQSGFYFGEFKVEYSDGRVETFPNVGYIEIQIADSLA